MGGGGKSIGRLTLINAVSEIESESEVFPLSFHQPYQERANQRPVQTRPSTHHPPFPLPPSLAGRKEKAKVCFVVVLVGAFDEWWKLQCPT